VYNTADHLYWTGEVKELRTVWSVNTLNINNVWKDLAEIISKKLGLGDVL